jgi:hypothetical protein
MTDYTVTVSVRYHDDLTHAQVADRIYGALMSRSESDGMARADVESVVALGVSHHRVPGDWRNCPCIVIYRETDATEAQLRNGGTRTIRWCDCACHAAQS